ncbi:MAG: hypothetical protein WC499_02535 [Patescibacteria group bacterium]
MLWTEQKKKNDKGEYVYRVEDFFGELFIYSKTKLDGDTLDLLEMKITPNPTGENKFVIKRKGGIILEVNYKLTKNKTLWEKDLPEQK